MPEVQRSRSVGLRRPAAVLRENLGSIGEKVWIAKTFNCDNGKNIHIGNNFTGNYNITMLDYLSRENGVPLCDEYDDLRRCKLNQPIYPASIRAMCAAEESDAAMKRAAEAAIPEFMRFNIVESEIRNVV